MTLQAKLKVFERAAGPGQFKVVGESDLKTVGIGVFTNPTRVPVKSGDLLGNSLFASVEGLSAIGAFFCVTGDPGVGAIVSTLALEPGRQNPITVTVEPDADGDGYGDETQDKCPTDASAQGTCPAPPPPAAPITLGATALAKKGFVTVALTASAQANVTVAGSVKLGKGSSAKLSGGTQIVAPGTLAKFTVLFPAKLKKALQRLPKSKKLTLALTAGAPGRRPRT